MLAFLGFNAFAQVPSVDGCAVALLPNVAETTEQRRAVYSFVNVHADMLYDRWSSGEQQTTGGAVAYELFSTEFRESKSALDFRHRVEERFAREGFASSEEQSRTEYKRWVEPEQLTAWSGCVAAVTGAPYLLVAPNLPPGQTTGTLRLAYRSGAPNQFVEIVISDGEFLAPSGTHVTVTGRTLRLVVNGDGAHPLQFRWSHDDRSDDELVITVRPSWSVPASTQMEFRLAPKPAALTPPVPHHKKPVYVFASDYDAGASSGVRLTQYAGYDALEAIGAPNAAHAMAFNVQTDEPGEYCLKFKYRDPVSHQSEVWVNNTRQVKYALVGLTRGFDSEKYGIVTLDLPVNQIVLKRQGAMPLVHSVFAVDPATCTSSSTQ
jgi:hypothetical protein